MTHRTDDEGWGEGAHIFDPVTATVRICDDLCSTCIFHPGNRMHLEPGRVKQMTEDAIADEGHIVCHKTLGTVEPAMCAGFARHPQAGARSLALRAARAGILHLKRITPPT